MVKTAYKTWPDINIIISLYKQMLQVQNVFGLFGIDFVIKTADGKTLDNDLLKNINNETIVVQKYNSFETVEIRQKESPFTQ